MVLDHHDEVGRAIEPKIESDAAESNWTERNQYEENVMENNWLAAYNW